MLDHTHVLVCHHPRPSEAEAYGVCKSAVTAFASPFTLNDIVCAITFSRIPSPFQRQPWSVSCVCGVNHSLTITQMIWCWFSESRVRLWHIQNCLTIKTPNLANMLWGHRPRYFDFVYFRLEFHTISLKISMAIFFAFGLLFDCIIFCSLFGVRWTTFSGLCECVSIWRSLHSAEKIGCGEHPARFTWANMPCANHIRPLRTDSVNVDRKGVSGTTLCGVPNECGIAEGQMDRCCTHVTRITLYSRSN